MAFNAMTSELKGEIQKLDLVV